jgi:hypothetical protein
MDSTKPKSHLRKMTEVAHNFHLEGLRGSRLRRCGIWSHLCSTACKIEKTTAPSTEALCSVMRSHVLRWPLISTCTDLLPNCDPFILLHE